MRVTYWGTRGSVATPGPETIVYGGDTACVAIEANGVTDHLLVLDAGTGIRRLGAALPDDVARVDLLLSHLHLDHVIGLGFFAPLFRPGLHLTIRAPVSTTPLIARLGRYLSPPLFPVRLRDVACELELRDAPDQPTTSGPFTITSAPVIHPDPAVGYRIEADGVTVAYLPDHEPALGASWDRDWLSGGGIAGDADLLIHDAQYTPDEYPDKVGWGHSSVVDAVAFADAVHARTLALFHHDPGRDDARLAQLTKMAEAASHGVRVVAARQDATVEVAA